MKAVSFLVLRFIEDVNLWRYIQIYIHPFLPFCPHPGTPKSMDYVREESGLSGLGESFTGSGQGV